MKTSSFQFQAALKIACFWSGLLLFLRSSTALAAKIPEVISNTTGLTTLEGLLESTGLADILEKKGPFTVFAPNNGAFLLLPLDVKVALSDPEQTDAVSDILTFHGTYTYRQKQR